MIKKKVSKTGKQKRASSEKRVLTSEKKKLINKSFKSQAKTVFRKFQDSLKTDDSTVVLQALNEVYSMADRGVKRGVFKLNQASRIKSRATLKSIKMR